MRSHPLTNSEIKRCFKKENRFNIVYSRNNFLKITDGVCVINFHEYKSVGTHQIAFYVNGDNMTYFDNFRVE